MERHIMQVFTNATGFLFPHFAMLAHSVQFFVCRKEIQCRQRNDMKNMRGNILIRKKKKKKNVMVRGYCFELIFDG